MESLANKREVSELYKLVLDLLHGNREKSILKFVVSELHNICQPSFL